MLKLYKTAASIDVVFGELWAKIESLLEQGSSFGQLSGANIPIVLRSGSPDVPQNQIKSWREKFNVSERLPMPSIPIQLFCQFSPNTSRGHVDWEAQSFVESMITIPLNGEFKGDGSRNITVTTDSKHNLSSNDLVTVNNLDSRLMAENRPIKIISDREFQYETTRIYNKVQKGSFEIHRRGINPYDPRPKIVIKISHDEMSLIIAGKGQEDQMITLKQNVKRALKEAVNYIYDPKNINKSTVKGKPATSKPPAWRKKMRAIPVDQSYINRMTLIRSISKYKNAVSENFLLLDTERTFLAAASNLNYLWKISESLSRLVDIAYGEPIKSSSMILPFLHKYLDSTADAVLKIYANSKPQDVETRTTPEPGYNVPKLLFIPSPTTQDPYASTKQVEYRSPLHERQRDAYIKEKSAKENLAKIINRINDSIYKYNTIVIHAQREIERNPDVSNDAEAIDRIKNLNQLNDVSLPAEITSSDWTITIKSGNYTGNV